jgi:3-dehydroquinate dehydratase II
MGKRLLVLHGPNLNLLGEREGKAGGRLADLDAALASRAEALGLALKVVQSNHEGVLIDTLHAERSQVEGVVVSPAGLFGSYPLMEALDAVGLPTLEVYLEPLGKRESVVAEACADTIDGLGFRSYLEALERFAAEDLTGKHSEGEEEADEEAGEDAEEVEASGPVKTLGRKAATKKAAAPSKPVAPERGKTLGRKVPAPVEPAAPSKTLGRQQKPPAGSPASGALSRALVRQKIADRLAGRLAPVELATWAKAKWLEVQRGGPAESGHRELLEETLQRLTLSTMPASRLSEPELVDLMTQLDR